MAEAIGFAILSAAGAFGASGAAALGSAVIVTGVNVATIVGTTALIAGSVALQAFTAPDTRERIAAQQYASKQSLPVRRRSYGRVKLAGPYMAFDSTGGAFLYGLYLGEAGDVPYDAVEQIWLDDQVSSFPSGATAGVAGIYPWDVAVELEAHLGDVPQAASALLLDLPYWSAAHRLDGCAYLVLRARAPKEDKFKKVYPSGTFPAARAVARTAKVRNPAVPAQTENPQTWAWTDLCTPCIRDLLTQKDWGFRVPAGLIDDVSFAAESTVDAQVLQDKAGAAIRRYTLSGTYAMTDEPTEALQGMLDACARDLFLTPDGKIGISGGRYVAPDVTIGQDAILSIASLEVGNGKRATFNRLKTSYCSPSNDYQVIEGDPWDDLPGQAEAGETLEADFARPWVTNHNQLRRLAKAYTKRKNPQIVIKGLVTNRKGLAGLYEDAVLLDLPRYGIGGPFTVERAVAASDGATCTYDLVTLDPTAWDFSAATEEGRTPDVANIKVPPALIPAPANLTATIERRAIGGGTTAAFLRLTATEPARPDLALIGQYRRVGDTAWNLAMEADGDTRGSVISTAPLADGEAYEPQGAVAGYNRAVQSGWVASTPATIKVAADPIAPAQPAYTSAARRNSTSYINDHVGKMSGSANARSLRLYRANGFGKVRADAGQVPVDTQAGSPNQGGLALSDIADIGLLKYWLTCANGSGVESAEAAAPNDILILQQVNNLLTAPNDLTNAAWAKTRLTAALSGTDPAGGTTTLLAETPTAGTHLVTQVYTLPGGSPSSNKFRFSVAIKAAGRTKGYVYLYDSTGASYVRATYDLAAGTITAVTLIGANASLGSAAVIKVSTDTYLVAVTGTIASTAAQARLQFLDDAGTASYTGDTAKGVYASAGTLALVA